MKGGDTSKKALDQTASMSPDERARRGLTPPTPPSGERAVAGAVDTPALGETLAAPGSGAGSGGAPVSLDVAALPVDDTGRYELSGVHARGGLGRIVKARDHRLHRTVAIKELLQRTPSTEARFVREALITARLEHPGIVPVHEAGRWPSGDPYYSMKLVSGRTLKELIQASDTLEARLALVPHVLAVAEAIAYAHSQRIIHRDIKPANVIVGDFGETVVVDWGLAKDLSGQLPEAELAEVAVLSAPGTTAVGNIMGTPSYMSPEQARGEELDARADVYSLGAMLYEVLVGEPPAHRRQRGPDPRQRAGRAAGADRALSAARAARPGGDRAQGDGAQPRGPLPDGGRAGRGHPPLPDRPAGHRAQLLATAPGGALDRTPPRHGGGGRGGRAGARGRRRLRLPAGGQREEPRPQRAGHRARRRGRGAPRQPRAHLPAGQELAVARPDRGDRLATAVPEERPARRSARRTGRRGDLARGVAPRPAPARLGDGRRLRQPGPSGLGGPRGARRRVGPRGGHRQGHRPAPGEGLVRQRVARRPLDRGRRAGRAGRDLSADRLRRAPRAAGGRTTCSSGSTSRATASTW